MHKLSELNQDSFAADHAVALDVDTLILWDRFVTDVSSMRTVLDDATGDTWALFHADTYCFAVALIALLAEGKTVYLPGDNHAGVTADLQDKQVAFIGQFPAPVCQEVLLQETAEPRRNFTLGGSIVVFTSGSTGLAKPIPKSIHQLDQELLTLESNWGTSWNNPVVVGTVSHQHLYGLLFSLLWPLCSGRQFNRKPYVDPAIMAAACNKQNESVWIMSPAHLHRLPVNMPWDDARGNVRAIFSSGGPLRQQSAQEVFEAIGQCPVEVLGSSETGGIASRQQHHSDTPWQPLPRVEIQLHDSGALKVRSPWLEDDNWHTSSDLATLNPGGTFNLGMRTDRIVKLEGKRIALPEVEAALAKHPWIDEAIAVAITRRREGLGALLVLTQAGSTAELDKGRHSFTRELRLHLREHVSAAAIPRFWRITDSLPKNAQGKVLVETVRELFDNTPLPKILSQKDIGGSYLIELFIERDCPYLEGHFPEHPVLPGVVQLLWAQHFARKCLSVTGEFTGMKKIKFRNIVIPDQKLSLTLEYKQESGRLTFYYDSGDGRHSQGTLLYGTGID